MPCHLSLKPTNKQDNAKQNKTVETIFFAAIVTVLPPKSEISLYQKQGQQF